MLCLQKSTAARGRTSNHSEQAALLVLLHLVHSQPRVAVAVVAGQLQGADDCLGNQGDGLPHSPPAEGARRCPAPVAGGADEVARGAVQDRGSQGQFETPGASNHSLQL